MELICKGTNLQQAKITVGESRLSRRINRFSSFHSCREAGTSFRLNTLWTTQYIQTLSFLQRDNLQDWINGKYSKTQTKGHHR